MAETLTVIGNYLSPYVRKVLVCLELKGIPYRIDPIAPFVGNEDFSRLSPLRRIPVHARILPEPAPEEKPERADGRAPAQKKAAASAAAFPSSEGMITWRRGSRPSRPSPRGTSRPSWP